MPASTYFPLLGTVSQNLALHFTGREELPGFERPSQFALALGRVPLFMFKSESQVRHEGYGGTAASLSRTWAG